MKRVLCAVLAALFLVGCAPQVPDIQRDIFAMDTVMNLQLWGPDAQAGADQVEQMIYALEQHWSATGEDSLTAALNRGETPELSPEDKLLISRVGAMELLTGEAFNPYLGAVSELWGFRSKNYRVPTQAEINEALSLRHLDMGAALKGYAGDKAVDILDALQVDRGILNLGGNVQTYGTKPDGSPWQIAIQDPQASRTLGVLAVEGTMSVVTSGSYQRFFEQDEKKYHHIMDSATGRPAESGLLSVTVICYDGLAADAFSTALFVMGLEKGTEFWRERQNFEAVFVLTDGTVYATQGAKLSGCDYKEITK